MKSNIGVCFVNYLFTPIFSGRAFFIQKLIPELEKRGIKTCVLTARLDNFPKYEYINGIHVYRMPILDHPRQVIRGASFALSCFVFIFFKGRKYNIIHLSSIWFSHILFKILGKNTIFDMTLLGSDDPQSIQSRFGWFALKLYAFADHFIGPSTEISRGYYRSNLPYWKFSQIPRGIDPEIFHPVDLEQKQIIRRRLNLPQNEKIVVSVGAIIQRKGIDFLIDSWTNICTHYQDVHLLLIGPFIDPDFFLEIKQKIQQNRIQNQVRFVGEVDNIPEYLQAADLFVHCSHREGLPNALIEAMSCELPCVVLRIKGITDDIITHYVDGIIVANRDINEYTKAILEVLKNDSLAYQIRNHARQKVLKQFSIDMICDQYIKLYEELLSRRI